MPRFHTHNVEDLKELLYNSPVHDANLETVEYDCREDSLKIQLCNPIFGVKIDITFHDIDAVLARKGDWPRSRETVLSLSVEEDLSTVRDRLSKDGKDLEGSLYLLLQMFSGDELHIVSKEVNVETAG